MKTRIERKLREAFSPSTLIIEDQSHLHVHHGNYAPGGGSHFKIILIAEIFKGYNRLQRHQKVYGCLESELKQGVHALCLKILCPDEAESLGLG
jgi:BolA protein